MLSQRSAWRGHFPYGDVHEAATVDLVAATWTWNQYAGRFNAAIGAGATATITVPVPAGSSLQRLMVCGGFNMMQVMSSPVGGNYPGQIPIVSEYKITSNPAAGDQMFNVDEFFVWDMGAPWSRASGTQTDEAVYWWATPPKVLDFDARIRFKGGANANVIVTLSALRSVAPNSVLAAPTGQPSGYFTVSALLSS